MDLIKFWIAIFGFAKASLFGSSRNLACALMWRGRTRGHNPTALGIWSRGRAVFARYPPGGTERSGPRNNANSLKFSNSKFSQVEKNSIRKPSKTSHEPHASKHERSEPDPQQAKTICIVAWQARAPDIIAIQADADTAQLQTLGLRVYLLNPERCLCWACLPRRRNPQAPLPGCCPASLVVPPPAGKRLRR